MRTRIVSAVEGSNRLTMTLAAPPMTWTSTTSATARTGRAKMTALRPFPAYHWPRPGHRKEKKVAMLGDRRPRSSMFSSRKAARV